MGMSSVLCAAPIELKVMALDGAPLQAAGVGVPFLVEVTASGRDTSQKPQIGGLENFQVQTAGIRVFTTNGDSSSTYTYKVRVDKPGNFIIGPAVFSTNGVRSESKAFRLVVENTQIIDPAYTKKVRAQAHDAFVELSIDKSKIFIGEPVIVMLTFLGKKNTVKLENIEEPKLPDFTLGAKTGPIIGSKTIDGAEYATAIWTWEFFPKKAGRFIIPASGASYQSEQEMHDNLSFFSPFFRVRAERKSTYSNACTLDVQELPVYKGHVDAVGSFKAFEAKINPVVAQEGEGMVFLLEVEGEGNLAHIKTPQLEQIPKALKWYDSKQYVRDAPGAYGLPVKCFEYIVQGLEHGSWEIPPQIFTYFDVKKREYITLKTASCAVTIKPNPAKVSYSNQASKNISTAENSAVDKDESRLPLNTWASWRPVHHRRHMPWLLFFLLIFLPMVRWIIKSIRLLLLRRAAFFTKRFAFKHALKKIDQAAGKSLKSSIHIIFLELFADRLQLAPAEVSSDLIEQLLYKVGFSDEDMRLWQEFYTRMYESAFFQSGNVHLNNDSLFKDAREWVKKLEKIL